MRNRHCIYCGKKIVLNQVQRETYSQTGKKLFYVSYEVIDHKCTKVKMEKDK